MIFRVSRDSIRQFRQTVSSRARQDGTRPMDGLPNGWTRNLLDHPADYSRLEPGSGQLLCFRVSVPSPRMPADISQVERTLLGVFVLDPVPCQMPDWPNVRNCALFARLSLSQEDLLRLFAFNIFPDRSRYWKAFASARCHRTRNLTDLAAIARKYFKDGPRGHWLLAETWRN